MFEFSIEPLNVTKELLLNKNSEEAYFAHYLGINPTKGLFKSPLRHDKNPTCSFYRNKKGELIFKDFGDGFSGNFINVVMELYKVPYYKAISIIANDFNIISKPHYEKHEPKIKYDGATVEEKQETIIQVEVKDYTEAELGWWATFGITEKTLKRFKVFSIKHVILNGNYMCTSTATNPIYGYYFGIKDGRELWKIYFPKKRKFRFLLNNSVLQGLKQLPKEKGKFVVVTKSMKDVMALYELGIPAVAPQAESVILPEKAYEKLAEQFEYVIINGDWDRAGQKFMAESRRRYKCFCLSFRDKKKFGKDISDFIHMHGTNKVVALVERLEKMLDAGRFNYQFKYFAKAT